MCQRLPKNISPLKARLLQLFVIPAQAGIHVTAARLVQFDLGL
jgi:hypothetical protein